MATQYQDRIDLDDVNRQFYERLNAPTRRSYTHRDVEDVKRDQHIGKLEDIFLFLAKTDYYVLHACTYSARRTLQALGGMVLFTGSLAFFSAMYTIMTTVVTDESSLLRWPIALALSAVYAFGIFMIDREIVASKGGFIPGVARFLFAMLIATAVSYPVKLKFFEGAIQTEIQTMAENRHSDALQKLENPNVQGRETQRDLIKKEIALLDIDIKGEQHDVQRQRDNVICDVKCQKHKDKVVVLQDKRQDALNRLSAIDNLVITDENKKEIERIKKLVEKEGSAQDLLTKWNAVDSIKWQPGSDYETISRFIFAFFMALELVPLILKYSLGKSEYNYYIMARDQLNAQKMISVTNLYIKAMQQDEGNVLKVPDEITDFFHQNMEDEATPRIVGYYPPQEESSPRTSAPPEAGAGPAPAAYGRTDPRDRPTPPPVDPDATIDESTPVRAS